MGSGELDAEGVLLALAATEKLPSEHRRHSQLTRLGSSLGDLGEDGGEVVSVYFRAIDRLPAEHRREDLLRRLLRHDDSWLIEQSDALLEAVARLEAEHRIAGVLSDLMPRLIADPDARERVLETVAALTTDHRVAELLHRLLDLRAPGELDETELGRMLNIAKSRVTSVTRRGPLIERIVDRLLI